MLSTSWNNINAMLYQFAMKQCQNNDSTLGFFFPYYLVSPILLPCERGVSSPVKISLAPGLEIAFTHNIK